MRVVVDTNVLVSALIKPGGVAARFVEGHLLASGTTLLVLVDERILAEYREVLGREKFGFEPELVEAFLAGIEAVSVLMDDVPALTETTTPAQDRPFLEVALAGAAAVLVTGNKKHFAHAGVDVMTPGEILRVLEDDDPALPSLLIPFARRRRPAPGVSLGQRCGLSFSSDLGAHRRMRDNHARARRRNARHRRRCPAENCVAGFGGNSRGLRRQRAASSPRPASGNPRSRVFDDVRRIHVRP